MADQEKLSAEENFQLLRNKLESEFRRKLFGGVNQQDVIKYIQSIREQSQQVVDIYEERIEELSGSNQMLRRQLEEYRNRIQEQDDCVNQLNGYIARMKDEKEKLQEKFEMTEQNLSDLMNDCEDKERTLCELEHIYKQEIETYRDEQSRLTREIDNYQEENNGLILEIKKYQEENNRLTMEIKTYQDENNGILRERDEIEKRADKLKGEVEKLKDYAAEMENAYQASASKINQQEQEIGLLKYQLAEREKTCRELGQQLAEEKTNGAAREKAKGDLEVQVFSLKEQIEHRERELIYYRKNQARMEEQLQQSQMQVVMLSEENVGLSNQLTGFQNQMEGIQKKIEFLEGKAKANSILEQQLERERMRANKAENDLALLKDWVAKVNHTFQNNQSKIDIRLREIEEKQYEINRKYVAGIISEASQLAENILISAQKDAECIIESANRRVQEITASYGTFQSDVIAFRNKIQDFQLKAGAEMDLLETAMEQPLNALKEAPEEPDENQGKIIQFSKFSG